MPAIIIDIDSYKEKIEGYDPSHSDKVHVESAKLANKEYEKVLKLNNIHEVILVCGGSASGKTEFIDWHLKHLDNVLIFDSTLSNFEGAVNKIRPALKKDKNIRIVLILSFNITSALLAYKERKRQFPVEHFTRTHSGSRKCFLELLKEYSNNSKVKFEIFTKFDKIDYIGYNRLIGDSKQIMNFVNSFQLTQIQIQKIINNIKL
jgi:hypothetical protein